MIDRTKIPYRDIPVLPLRNSILFPGQVIPVIVGRPRSLAAVDGAMAHERWILVLSQKSESGDASIDELYRTGVLARIESRTMAEGGRGLQLVIQGHVRFQASELRDGDQYLIADGAVLDDVLDLEGDTSGTLMQNMKALAREIFSHYPPALAQLVAIVTNVSDPSELLNIVSQHLELKVQRKQEILEMVSLKNRFLVLLDLMVKARDELKLQREVQQKVSSKIGKQQREALLREQIRALQEELGEGRDELSKDYLKRIEESGMPEEVKKVALEQLSRLEALPNASPELHVIRNYLDLLVALPWTTAAESEIDLEKARVIFERDHYGLEKIKKRIIQHLAVMKLKKEKKGSILLFVGPPGVGKTSLARSIAEVLGRQYVRISLGGVRDDAEIRGHRRTYVGALPGRIIDGIKRAGENNPVFVLDEIDKLNRGWGGDPASAMLEVLDPEQNAHFLDHYLDVPFNLSHVFFVATANSLDTIPGPLLDRMEVIELTGYTTQEKMHIARRHLFPKQLEEHGLTRDQVTLSEDALLKLVTGHTREAGVRELQRQIAALIRYAAEVVVGGVSGTTVSLTPEVIEEALGPDRFILEVAERESRPGVVTGLAWTPLGGDILFVESRMMPGKGQLTLTGQLGDVMKESAQIAYSHIRSRLPVFNQHLKLDQVDIHLHVPSGAIPKDGPSAGVTMLISMASLIMNKAPPAGLAMTGEITLRGAVMPVGGIKEKLIAAHRAGIRAVLLPRRNERDLRDVPEEIRKQLKIIFIESVEDLFKETLGLSVSDLGLDRSERSGSVPPYN